MPPPPGPPRRALRFERFDQIMPDVERLARGHRMVGNWTLGQMCNHLAGSFRGSLDGFDMSRHFIKRTLFRRLLRAYTFRYGIPPDYLVDRTLTPAPDADPARAIEDLRAAIARYRGHSGPLRSHPLFGRMDRPTWDRIHLIHSAHHLSFALPTAASPASDNTSGS